MTTRRLAVYLLIDIALWGIALWLLCGDPTYTRLVFWHNAKNAAQRGATALGIVAIECEMRYDAVRGSV